MSTTLPRVCQAAREAAMEVLRHNLHGPYRGPPRTAGWGYPEPYTRDLMIAGLGSLVSGDAKMIAQLRRVLESLAEHQSPLGHIPSLAHDREDRGASDTTPLFLLLTGIWRQSQNEPDFLAGPVEKALTWMAYQSPSDRTIVAQLPTTDWRDEQWVLGFGLFVNAVVYGYLRLLAQHERADQLASLMHRFTITARDPHQHVHEGLVVRHKPYFAMYSFKVYSSERFDLLGNSLAILVGLASRTRADDLVGWVEHECRALQERGLLAVDLPPNFFPYMQPGDPDWLPRYEHYNQPGTYHNGGIWPFICGFYVAALIAAGRPRLAKQKLVALAELCRPAREQPVDWGFNEYCRAQDGRPSGQDWQTWSAAMYLYAAACVERGQTPFFDALRTNGEMLPES